MTNPNNMLDVVGTPAQSGASVSQMERRCGRPTVSSAMTSIPVGRCQPGSIGVGGLEPHTLMCEVLGLAERAIAIARMLGSTTHAR